MADKIPADFKPDEPAIGQNPLPGGIPVFDNLPRLKTMKLSMAEHPQGAGELVSPSAGAPGAALGTDGIKLG